MLYVFSMILELDTRVLLFVNALSGKSSALDGFMIFLSSNMPWIVLAGGTLAYLLIKGKHVRLATILFGLLALGLSDLVSFEIVKPFVGRDRPCWIVPGINKVLGYCGGSYGFTSNHAANAAAFTMSLIISKSFSRMFVSVVCLFALLIGLSRVYLGVHYPGDVLGGFALGIMISLILFRLGLFTLTTKISQKIAKTN
jgi:undecaprenyl-diphosphatase